MQNGKRQFLTQLLDCGRSSSLKRVKDVELKGSHKNVVPAESLNGSPNWCGRRGLEIGPRATDMGHRVSFLQLRKWGIARLVHGFAQAGL